MPKLEDARKERRRAENEVVLLQARIRLLRETADHNERKAARAHELKAKNALVQGDAEWVRNSVESACLRRDIGSIERQMLAKEQKEHSVAHLEYSRKSLAETRAANADRQRREVQSKLDAAYSMQQSDWVRKRMQTESQRTHAAWYREANAQAARDFSLRLAELKGMAVAEEETRIANVHERARGVKAALVREAERALKVSR